MVKVASGFILGCVLSALVVYYVVLPRTRESYLAVGKNSGAIDAKAEIANLIPRKLGGDVSRDENYEPLFEVKATSVVIVERNGVKTLRVIE